MFPIIASSIHLYEAEVGLRIWVNKKPRLFRLQRLGMLYAQMRDSLSLGVSLFLRETVKRFGLKKNSENTQRTGLEDNFYLGHF